MERYLFRCDPLWNDVHVQLPLHAGGAGILYGLAMLVHIGIIIWTYNDASANSDQPAFLCAIVVLLAPLFGILLYLLLGRR